MRTVAITLEGVLRKPLDVEAQDTGGSMLYASLVDNFRLVVLGGYNPAADEQFLTMNGLLRHVRVEPMRAEDGPTEISRKIAQLKRLRSEGYSFEFIVLPEPDVAQRLIRDGFPVLLYAHPRFSPASFQPDGIRAWGELEAEVNYSVRTRAEQRKAELRA